jgi:hypothetical protein
MSFQYILYIWLAVILVAYISGWVVHIMGPRTGNLSGVFCHSPVLVALGWPRSGPRTLMTTGVSDNPAQASLPKPRPNLT